MNLRKVIAFSFLTIASVLIIGCGTTEVVEVVKEVPVEIIKTEQVIVEKEVPVEIQTIKEVVVEKIVEKEVTVQIPGQTVVVEKIIEVEKPQSYSEAPEMAQLVAAGKLPPVEERLPENPMIMPVFGDIGKYGGTLRRNFLGPSDVNCNVGRVNGVMATRWTNDGLNVTPFVAESWESGNGGKEWTINLRKGLKWSNGDPHTADDWVYTLDDYMLNKAIRSPAKWAKGPGASPATIEKIDDYTVKYTYDVPYMTLPAVWAGHACMSVHYPFVPSKYMKQFHLKYNENAEKIAKDAGFDSWGKYYVFMNDKRDNLDRPTMTPWVMQNTRGDEVIKAIRNPYYFVVDAEGNQLPYINDLRFELATDSEVLMLRAIQGELDFQARHIQLTNYTVLKQNESKGDYRVQTISGFGGNDAMMNMNVTYQGPEGELLNNRDFRIGLSHAIDREFIQSVTFMGLGLAGNYLPPPGHPQHPGPEYETKNATYDVALANELLDKVAPNKDADGFRTLPNGDKLELKILGTAAFGAWPDIAETVAGMWAEVGVRARPDFKERSLMNAERRANEHHIYMWGPGRAVNLFVQSPWVDCDVDCPWGQLYTDWYNGGENGIEPPDDVKRITQIVSEGTALTPAERDPMAKEIYAYIADEQLIIGTVRRTPMVMGVTVINKDLMNVPESWANDTLFDTPFPAYPEQFWFRTWLTK